MIRCVGNFCKSRQIFYVLPFRQKGATVPDMPGCVILTFSLTCQINSCQLILSRDGASLYYIVNQANLKRIKSHTTKGHNMSGVPSMHWQWGLAEIGWSTVTTFTLARRPGFVRNFGELSRTWSFFLVLLPKCWAYLGLLV